MMKFIRKIRGCGRREAEADKVVRDHHKIAAAEIRVMTAKVSAAEKLVQGLRKDATQWPLY